MVSQSATFGRAGCDLPCDCTDIPPVAYHCGMEIENDTPRPHGDAARTAYGAALAALSLLFALRVAGQALQRWAPQTFLPDFRSFQGSSLPYPVLLSTQLVILALMSRATYLVRAGRYRRTARATRVLWWVGAVYMVASLSRMALGLGYAHASSWFTAWIPAFFHVVLAGFLLTLAAAPARTTADIAR